MKSYLDLRNNNDYSRIKEAAQVINKGGLVLFPTETVYGIGANGLDFNAVKGIFKAKGRAQDNPLILHISNMEMLDKIAKDITDLEYKLMNSFWPGPFTIILKRTNSVPDVVTAGLDTVAVRMPSNRIAKELIEYSNTPIAAPSANISGKPSGTNIEDIFRELSDKVDYIIDGGQCEIGLESTVVRVIDKKVNILRPGKITKEEIEKVAEGVIIDQNVFGKIDESEKVLSPGMKYKHYAPQSKCVLVYSKNNDNMVKRINDMTAKYKNPLVICHTNNIDKYNTKHIIDMGQSKEDISKNIFKTLRRVDSYNPDIVIIEGVDKEGLGLAIMNRLIRACEHNYIEI